MLFPIDWPEPFGLVLIEALATGTPVIAFGRGSVPEIIEDGLTGFIVDDVAAAVAAVPWAKQLDRGAIRRRFEERFTADRMARDYLALYWHVLGDGSHADEPKLLTFRAAGGLTHAADSSARKSGPNVRSQPVPIHPLAGPSRSVTGANLAVRWP